MRDPAAGARTELTSAINAGEPLMISLLYGDFECGQRVIAGSVRRANERWLASPGRQF